jgi:uncharacterized protein
LNLVFVDTSFVIALINERDQYHQQAMALVPLFESRQLVTTDAVLLEIGNALAKDYRQAAVMVLNKFINSDNVEVVALDQALRTQAIALYSSRIDKAWGLVDCVSFTVMRDRAIQQALTHDQHFAQANFIPLMRSPSS